MKIDDSEAPAESVGQVINQTWRLLTGRPPEPGMSLEEAGGDSLGVIEIIFNLERMLAAKLPMDRFHSGLTAEEFTREAVRTFVDPKVKRRLQTPIFFFTPGLGDSAYLADFRRSGGDKVCFVAIEYPDWRRCVASGFGVHSLIDAVLAQIRAHVPSGPVRLAGYSFGGLIAYAAAVALEVEGREVSFLGILDAPAPGLVIPRVDGTTPHRLRPYWGAIRGIAAIVVAPREQRNRQLGRVLARPLAIEWVAPLRGLLARRSARRASRLSIGRLSDWTIFYLGALLLNAACTRAASYDRSTGLKLSAPIVLFRCAGWLANAEPDFGWGRVAENVTVVPVPGDHWSTVHQPHVKSTATAFVDALAVIEGNRSSRRGQADYLQKSQFGSPG